MKIYRLASRTLSIAGVGSCDNSSDKARIYFVSDWLSDNDPQYYSNTKFTHDHINLHDGRDFLKEGSTYNIVVLQHVYNPEDDYKGMNGGNFKISPNHTKENWVRRLIGTNADYIFAFGSWGEIGGSYLGNIPGYQKIIDGDEYRTIYRNGKLPQINIQEKKPVKWEDVDTSWIQYLKPDALDNLDEPDKQDKTI